MSNDSEELKRRNLLCGITKSGAAQMVLTLCLCAASASAATAPGAFSDSGDAQNQCSADSSVCPDACRTVRVVCADRPSATTDICQGHPYCVIRPSNGSGACILGVPQISATAELCGRTLPSIDAARAYIDALRNALGDAFDRILRDSSITDEERLSLMFHLLTESCSLQDEFLHLVDQYACRHHMSCEERQSGLAFIGCYTNSLSTELMRRIVAGLPNLADSARRSYCATLAGSSAGAAYDGCVCDTTRSSCQPLTMQQCASCLDTCKQQAKERMRNSSICSAYQSVTDPVIDEACGSYLDTHEPGNGSHLCATYVKNGSPTVTATAP